MKKFVISSLGLVAFAAPAFAADMPVKAPMAPVAVPYNWTGLYIGLTAGYGWGRYTQFADPLGDGPRVDPKGFVGGGTIGYNWQMSNWLLGVEADFQNGPRGSDPVGTASPVFTCGTGPCRVDVDWFGTVRGRLGITSAQWLFYATGGLAYGRFDGGIDNSVATGSSTKVGWTAGGGIEYAFAPAWSVKGEYLHVDLGRADLAPLQAPCCILARGKVSSPSAVV